ncbi:MAG: acyl-CoA thioesterase, partial [Acidobacteriota bacterium]
RRSISPVSQGVPDRWLFHGKVDLMKTSSAGSSPPEGGRLAPVRTPAASRVEMTTLVIPEDTNIYGNVFGGRVMELMDKAAAIASLRHCRTGVVTASLDSLDFIHPISLGNIITVLAQVNAAWRSSMEVGVKVFSEDALTGERVHTCTAYLTMVALSPDGRPARGTVPPLRPETREDRRRMEEAAKRRRQRLQRITQRPGA